MLLARRQGLLRRRAARPQGPLSRAARRSSTRRSTTSTGSSTGACWGYRRRLHLRAQRRQGFRRQGALPGGAGPRSPREQRAGHAAGPLRRPQRGARGHRRAPEGAQAAARSGRRRRSARCSSGSSADGLVDLRRALDPDNEGLFTWWAPWRNMRERNIGWRLDYVLASAGSPQPSRPVPCSVTSAPRIRTAGSGVRGS